MISSLYVHIPFCSHICAYCDFPKVLFAEKWAFPYLSELRKEIESYQPKDLATIYVGGGTPTSLPDGEFGMLLSMLSPLLRPGGEFTIEANPESLTAAKLSLMQAAGVNRLSIGVESSSPRLLGLMGRRHSFIEAAEKVALARTFGFANVNCDLIYGLPQERAEELEADAKAFLSLGVPHLSAYCLSVSPGTMFHLRGYGEMEEDAAADEYEMILRLFRKAGYDRYEVSNFAKEGFQCRHNLVYWRDEDFYGAGLGASGFANGIRYENTRNLTAYLAGSWRKSEEKEAGQSALESYFLTNLRLENGFSLSAFASRFGFAFGDRYGQASGRLQAEGLLEEKEGRIFCTDRGLLLLDRVLVALY